MAVNGLKYPKFFNKITSPKEVWIVGSVVGDSSLVGAVFQDAVGAEQLTQASVDIAKGLAYLAEHNLVHR